MTLFLAGLGCGLAMVAGLAVGQHICKFVLALLDTPAFYLLTKRKQNEKV